MKKLIITSIVALTASTAFGSDYIPQVVTSEVFTEQVQVTEESYKAEYVNHRNFDSMYCQYKDDRDYCNRRVVPRPQKLQPVAVHAGKTVIVQDHYEVYQPKVVYEKMGGYTTTKVCEYCK